MITLQVLHVTLNGSTENPNNVIGLLNRLPLQHLASLKVKATIQSPGGI